jgi:polyisoprenyl-teichoic acid--peptidoglycan teichoic acid transferase
MRNPLVRLLVTIPLCGVLVAGLLSAAWLALGRPSVADAAFLQVEQVGASEFTGAPTEPFFFLALGNDSRDANGQGLGDAIHVIGVNPATKEATILNVPRDTSAPGGGKINGYHSQQGLPGFIDQVNQMMGIQINYAITTDFPRFIDMVNQIGGIDINLPYGFDDQPNSGAVFLPGQQKLDGHQVLAVSRDRYSFIEGDVKRTENQGLVILAALATLRAKVDSGEFSPLKLISILGRGITTENVSLPELYKLGQLALQIDPASVKNITIPTGGGAGTDLDVAPDAQTLFQDFADDAIVQSR